MTTALAPTVNNSAISTSIALGDLNHPEHGAEMEKIVEKVSKRKLATNSTTIESFALKHDKLVDSVRAEIKSLLNIAKTEKLPGALYDSLVDAVNRFTMSRISTGYTLSNIVSDKKSYHHDKNNLCLKEKRTLVSIEAMALNNQLFGVKLLINATAKRREKAVLEYRETDKIDDQLKALERTKREIEFNIEKQKEADKAASTGK